MRSEIIKKANENIEKLIDEHIIFIKRHVMICNFAKEEICTKYTCEECHEAYYKLLKNEMQSKYYLSEKDFDKYSFKTRFYPMFEDDRAYYQYESYSGYHIHWIDGLYSLLIEDTVIFEGKTFEELEKFFIDTFEEDEKDEEDEEEEE